MAELSAFNPTLIVGDVPVMRIEVDGKKIIVNEAGEKVSYGPGNPLRKYVPAPEPIPHVPDIPEDPLDGLEHVDASYEWFSAKVCSVAFAAAHIPGGSKWDDHNNMATGLGNCLVELAVCDQKSGAHRRLIVRIPDEVELEIVEVL